MGFPATPSTGAIRPDHETSAAPGHDRTSVESAHTNNTVNTTG